MDDRRRGGGSQIIVPGETERIRAAEAQALAEFEAAMRDRDRSRRELWRDTLETPARVRPKGTAKRRAKAKAARRARKRQRR